MIAVTGATGHLGRLILEGLLEHPKRSTPLVAVVRSPERARDLAERGVEVRQADYDRPDTLGGALAGVDTLMLVSASEVGKRADQHRNVVEAAVEAGVHRLVYTSLLHADTSGMQLAQEHSATEEMIRGSGISYIILRNGWYIENYTAQLPQYLEYGVILGCADEGRISAAARADYADAAVAVLMGSGHEGATYELGGDEAFSMIDLAAEISRQTGQSIEYRDLTEEAYVQALLDAKVPEVYARMLADSDVGITRGELYTDSRDLSRLIGRPTTPMREVIAATLDR